MITLKDDSEKGARTAEFPLELVIFDGTILPEIPEVRSFMATFDDPVPRIEYISSTGKLVMKWSQPMLMFNMTWYEEQLQTLVTVRDIKTS